MPVREIPIGNRAVTGLHAKSATRYESSLERDFFELVMSDPSVSGVEGQPVRIEYVSSDGRWRHYTPDALVTYKPDPQTGEIRVPLLCEIKYREEYRAKFKELRPRIRAAKAYAKAHGLRFKVVTDREIRTVQFSNLRFLSAFRDRSPDQVNYDRIQAILGDGCPRTPFELLNIISADPFEQAAVIPTLWWMVSNRRIDVDLTVPLTMNSKLANLDE